MTNNDAAKAFNGCRTNTVLNGNMVVYYIPLQQEEKIRTALTKSAKVDGLLDALNKITRVKTLPDHSLNTFNLTTVHLIANEAIQRFNGEV